LGTDQLRYTNDKILNLFTNIIKDNNLNITFTFNKKITTD